MDNINNIYFLLYFIIKWAVKNGEKQAFRDITNSIQTNKILKTLQLEDEKKKSN